MLHVSLSYFRMSETQELIQKIRSQQKEASELRAELESLMEEIRRPPSQELLDLRNQAKMLRQMKQNNERVRVKPECHKRHLNTDEKLIQPGKEVTVQHGAQIYRPIPDEYICYPLPGFESCRDQPKVLAKVSWEAPKSKK